MASTRLPAMTVQLFKGILLWAFPHNFQYIVEIHFLNSSGIFIEIIDAMFLYIQEIKAFHIMISIVTEFFCRH